MLSIYSLINKIGGFCESQFNRVERWEGEWQSHECVVDEGSMEQYEDKDEDEQLNKRSWVEAIDIWVPIFFFFL